MKPPGAQPGIRSKDGGLYRVSLHREVQKTIEEHGLDSTDVAPTLAAMHDDLEIDPKRFPKKHGKLARARAYALRHRGSSWRAIFAIDELNRFAK